MARIRRFSDPWTSPPRFALEWKRPPLPVGYVVGLPAVSTLFSVVSYGEEQ